MLLQQARWRMVSTEKQGESKLILLVLNWTKIFFANAVKEFENEWNSGLIG